MRLFEEYNARDNRILLLYAIWRYYLHKANEYGSVLYIGVTSDLFLRIPEHKNKAYPDSFTAKYNCNKLVYYETYARIENAIAREKQLKNGTGHGKIYLMAYKNAMPGQAGNDGQVITFYIAFLKLKD